MCVYIYNSFLFQSKIARLAKKFGAANQASENSRKAQEVSRKVAISNKLVNLAYPQFFHYLKMNSLLWKVNICSFFDRLLPLLLSLLPHR